MAIDDSKKDVMEAYKKAVKSNDTLTQKDKELKDIAAANLRDAKIQQNAAQAEALKAAKAVISKKRENKLDEAIQNFDRKHQGMKENLFKGYDTFMSAMGDIGALSLAMSEALNAQMWAVLAGPMMDMGVSLAKLPFTKSVDAVVWAANELSKKIDAHGLPPELLKISPLEMVSVSKSGELKFESFTDRDELVKEGSDIHPDLLRAADSANIAAVTYLVKNAGYEYNSGDNCYQKNDGTKLKQEDLGLIINNFSNLTKFLEKTVRNKPPEPEPENNNTFGMR